MSIRNTLILVLLVAVAAAGITRYYFPKLEYKSVEVVKEVVKTDIHTVTRTIERPDGTKETVVDSTDKSVKHETASKEVTVAAKNQWMFGVGARTNFTDHAIVYDLQVERRIIGPFFLGAKAGTDHSVGVTVGMEF